jgi:hypothetical protein
VLEKIGSPFQSSSTVLSFQIIGVLGGINLLSKTKIMYSTVGR